MNKTWQEIEEEFKKQFVRLEDVSTFNDERCRYDYVMSKRDYKILAFFKPYFQEKLHKEAKEELESTNYVQVGDMVECGHCQMDKFAVVLGMKCDCKCHKVKPESSWERDTLKSEVAVFWDEIAQHLPKSMERSALGDEKICRAFSIAYPKIRGYLASKVEKEAYERGRKEEQQSIFAKIDSAFNQTCRGDEILYNDLITALKK